MYRVVRRITPVSPRRDSLLLEFLELTVQWVDHACLAMAAGHHRGELSRARELQHVQTNLVRRVLSGTASGAELRVGLEPLSLDPDRLYVAVCARPTVQADTAQIEQYLCVDGFQGRRHGLTALIDGDVCGFVLPELPVGPAPTMIGLSEPGRLTDFPGPFRRAMRALETSLSFGVNGTFAFSSLAMQAGILRDRDIADVLRARYLEPLSSSAGGEAILDTLDRLLANDQNVAATAEALGVHPNTVRHRVKRFEELTGASIGEHQTAIELWWALQSRQLTGH
jgi:hypothetical protein